MGLEGTLLSLILVPILLGELHLLLQLLLELGEPGLWAQHWNVPSLSRISANFILGEEGWAAEPGYIPWVCLEVSLGLVCKIQSSLPSGKLVPSWMQDLRGEIPGESSPW